MLFSDPKSVSAPAFFNKDVPRFFPLKRKVFKNIPRKRFFLHGTNAFVTKQNPLRKNAVRKNHLSETDKNQDEKSVCHAQS